MRTLGLLEVDVLDQDLIGDYGSYGQMTARLFDELQSGLTYRYYQVQQGEFPQSADECDAYLITGSRVGAYDDLPWLAGLQDWIRAFHHARAKLIGICFGHQIIAQALGGRVEKSSRGWGLGFRKLALNADPLSAREPALGAMSDHLGMLYSHQDQVVLPPPEATVFAGDEFCPNGAMLIADRVISFQGHPEFTPDYLKRLMIMRRDRYPEPLYDAALNDIERETDRLLVGQWLLNFIRGCD